MWDRNSRTSYNAVWTLCMQAVVAPRAEPCIQRCRAQGRGKPRAIPLRPAVHTAWSRGGGDLLLLMANEPLLKAAQAKAFLCPGLARNTRA